MHALKGLCMDYMRHPYRVGRDFDEGVGTILQMFWMELGREVDRHVAGVRACSLPRLQGCQFQVSAFYRLVILGVTLQNVLSV